MLVELALYAISRRNFVFDRLMLINEIHAVIISDWTVRRYAMKCLDKKRIKMKGGETLALNERIMLSLVSHGVTDTTHYITIRHKSRGFRVEALG